MVDSSGQFTLEQSKAWEKLGSFQLPFPNAWVLKLVQAAVAHPTGRLEITQTRAEVIFCVAQVGDWTRKAVEKAVFQLSDESSRALAHLAVGIRALVQLKTRPFSIQYPNGNHHAWDGKRFVDLPDDSKVSGTFSISVANFEFGQSGSVFAREFEAMAYRAEIVTTLSQHCHFGPVSLKVDSRESASFLGDPRFGITEQSRPLALLKAPPASKMPTFVIAEPEEFEGEAIGNHSIALPELSRNLGQECSAAGLLSAFVKQKEVRTGVYYYDTRHDHSEILWIRDGVIVQREKFLRPYELGLAAIVSAEGLETDLSGLVPRQGEAKNQRRDASIKLLATEVLKFQKALGPDGFKVEHEMWKTYLTGLAGGLLLFAVPIIGLAVLTKAGYDYSSKERRAGYLNTALDRGLERLVESLKKEAGL